MTFPLQSDPAPDAPTAARPDPAPTPERPMRQSRQRREFLQERLLGVGGSDAGHLFGLEPYGCRRRLWYEKTRHPADYPFEGNAATARGTALEPLVAHLYASETGRRLRRRNRALVSDDYPHALAHVDRLIRATDDGRGPGVLEIKAPSMWEYKRLKREGLPPAYVLQLQHGLLVTGCTWGAFAVFSAELWELTHFEVERDEALCVRLGEECERFWRHVENGPPPERLEPGDRRCHGCPWRRTCLAGLPPPPQEEAPGEAEQDPSLDGEAREYLEAKRLAEEAEALAQSCRERLLARLGERRLVETGGVRLAVRSTLSKRVDLDGLRHDHPELAEKYLKVSIVRSLRVQPLT